MRAREFYVEEFNTMSGVRLGVSSVAPRPPTIYIHVREVVPIDWGKVWAEIGFEYAYENNPEIQDKIQQLVERQLKKGEE